MKYKPQRCAKRKPTNGLGHVNKKRRFAKGRDREPAGRAAAGLTLPCDFSGEWGTFIFLAAMDKARGEHGVCFGFSHHFFSVCSDRSRASMWHADVPFHLLSSARFPDLPLFLTPTCWVLPVFSQTRLASDVLPSKL